MALELGGVWVAVSSASLCTRKTGWPHLDYFPLSPEMDGPGREWAGRVGAESPGGLGVVGGKPARVRSWPSESLPMVPWALCEWLCFQHRPKGRS